MEQYSFLDNKTVNIRPVWTGTTTPRNRTSPPTPTSRERRREQNRNNCTMQNKMNRQEKGQTEGRSPGLHPQHFPRLPDMTSPSPGGNSPHPGGENQPGQGQPGQPLGETPRAGAGHFEVANTQALGRPLPGPRSKHRSANRSGERPAPPPPAGLHSKLGS